MRATTAFVLLDPVKLWTFLDLLLLGVDNLNHITRSTDILSYLFPLQYVSFGRWIERVGIKFKTQQRLLFCFTVECCFSSRVTAFFTETSHYMLWLTKYSSSQSLTVCIHIHQYSAHMSFLRLDIQIIIKQIISCKNHKIVKLQGCFTRRQHCWIVFTHKTLWTIFVGYFLYFLDIQLNRL